MKKAIRIEIIKKSFITNNNNKTNNKSTSKQKKFSISLLKEDLTIQETNAIVNAANSQLQLGAGVAGAIRAKGGNKIQEECDEILFTENNDKSLSNGEVAYTNIGKFNNTNLKFIFHAVGPMYFNGNRNEERDLTSCFLNCFLLADRLQLSSIALPPISTGIFGYPKEEGAEVFFDCVEKYFVEFLNGNKKEIKVFKDLDAKEELNEHKYSKVKNAMKNDSFYVDKNFLEKNSYHKDISNSSENNEAEANEIKVFKHKVFENINQEVNIEKKTELEKFEDINKSFENMQSNKDINFSFSTGNNEFSKININENNNQIKIKENGSEKSKINVNCNFKGSKEEKKHNSQKSKTNNCSLYQNYDEFEFLNGDESMKDNQEKDKFTRIIRCKFNENSKIQLENFTLNDINMAIIDNYTHEVFFDVLKEKLGKWKQNSEYEIIYSTC